MQIAEAIPESSPVVLRGKEEDLAGWYFSAIFKAPRIFIRAKML